MAILAQIKKTSSGEELSYFYNDDLGSRRAIVSSSGALVEEIKYTAFGELQPGSNRENASFTGKQMDATGLYYFNARYYDPDSSRFLTQDPSKQGSGWYTYCDNNPTNHIDPDGRQLEVAARVAADTVNQIPSILQAILAFAIAKGLLKSAELVRERAEAEKGKGFKLGQCIVSDATYRNEETGLHRPPHAGPGWESPYETFGEYLNSMGEPDLEKLAKMPVPIILIRNEKGQVIAGKLIDGTHRALLIMKGFGRNVDLYDPKIRGYWIEVQPHEIKTLDKSPIKCKRIDEIVRNRILEGIKNDIGPDLFTAYDEWQSGKARSQKGEWIDFTLSDR